MLHLTSAQAQALDYVEASYSVQYNNKQTAAENHLKVARDGNRYRVNFELDHWLLTAKQKANFEMQDCKVRPMSYVSINKQPFKDEKTQTIEFDWKQNKAKYTSADEEKTFDLTPALYDPLSFFFEARCELMAGKTEFTYPLIYKGNKRNHSYKVVGTDSVKTGQGTVQAIVIERVRNSATRKTRLYVAPSLDYLLVKFEHQESRLATIAATLDHMDYRLSND